MASNNKSNKHQKHVSLSKASHGRFGRNELGIIGTTCEDIKQFSEKLINRLSREFYLGYVDAEHGRDAYAKKNTSFDKAGLIYTKKRTVQRFDYQSSLNEWQIKTLFNEQDLVLVNGNHFRTQHQILVIDPRKPLEKKLDKLTNIRLIILKDNASQIPEHISDHIDDIAEIPVFKIDELDSIAEFITRIIQNTIPLLNGLVLAGGKSTRMHTDKTLLNYHGKPQRQFLYELLKKYCSQVFLSCRRQQVKELAEEYRVIADSYLDMGPLGGLLSAFRKQPNTAFLSIACDLPLLSPKTLEYLVKHRNASKIATAFRNPESDFPEPLITIWEPKSYSLLLQFLGLGYSCPRKALINSDIELLEAPEPRELMNANNPDEYEEAVELIADS